MRHVLFLSLLFLLAHSRCPPNMSCSVSVSATIKFASKDDKSIEWKQFRWNLYGFFDSEKTWNEAEAYCRSQKAHLASVHSKEEMGFVVSTFGLPSVFHRAWIGAKRNANDFKWADGTALNFTNWKPLELTKAKANCANVISSGKTWSDDWSASSCDSKFSFFCKK